MIARIQAQLRASAGQTFEAVPVPPFTCYFNPDGRSVYANYAIPDSPVGGDLSEPLAVVRAAFAAHDRVARFEFLADYAPNLPEVLEAAGFVEQERTQLMICAPEEFRRPPAVPDLTVTPMKDRPRADWQAFVTVQRRAFEGDDDLPLVSTKEADIFRRRFGSARMFLARLEGEAAAVGSLLPAHDRVAEVAGIATAAPFRRRGIAGLITAVAAQTAFDQGAELVFLTAADAAAGRVYERIGFRPAGLALAYVDKG